MGRVRRGGRLTEESDFVAYYTARGGSLRQTAYLLCGDWHLAEDLTQTAFTKLYQAWHRIERRDGMDQYARQVLLRAFLDERRRPWRRERAVSPDSVALDSRSHHDPEPDDRVLLRAALSRLSKRHRAVLVLRFWADLSVEQVAEALGCSTGTVKSQTSRGLANLRQALEQLQPRPVERCDRRETEGSRR
jgi:RNA polymerase sigma-70 factor (sigma-E family)